MSDRAGRETGEGRIGVHIDPSRKVGAMIELRCETAPVASNDLFMDLVKSFAQKAAEWKGDLTADALRADPALDTQFTEVFGRLLDGAGNPLGGVFRISTMGPDGNANHDGSDPAVAFGVQGGALTTRGEAEKVGGDSSLLPVTPGPSSIWCARRSPPSAPRSASSGSTRPRTSGSATSTSRRRTWPDCAGRVTRGRSRRSKTACGATSRGCSSSVT